MGHDDDDDVDNDRHAKWVYVWQEANHNLTYKV